MVGWISYKLTIQLIVTLFNQTNRVVRRIITSLYTLLQVQQYFLQSTCCWIHNGLTRISS